MRASIWILSAIVAGAPLHAVAQSGAGTTPPTKTALAPTRNIQVLPGTRSDVFGNIRGSAVDSNNAPLADTGVRLRDARFGRIVDTTVTDKLGQFTFRGVDPGSYIVEIMSPERTVLAASDIINVNAGDAVTALVKLPSHSPPLAGVLGRTAASAMLVTAAAAASGILATQIAGEQKSPRQ